MQWQETAHLRVFAVKKQFLGGLVLHLLATLVARHIPVLRNENEKTENNFKIMIWHAQNTSGDLLFFLK